MADASVRIRVLGAALLASLMLAGWLGLRLQAPPPPVPAQAPPEVFSAERALAHLTWIAAEEHSLGTAAHATVAARLENHLRASGLEVQVQDTTYTTRRGIALPIKNLMARLKGTSGGPAVLLLSHYDSAFSSPGASDAGVGVASVLECLRTLKAGPPPVRDIVFLLTDAEEMGLLGARVFVREHPWAREVGVAINLEARGTTGRALLFQTSPGSGDLVKAYAQHVPHPFATSLADAVYRRMPNDTDLTVLLAAGVRGMNLAFVLGAQRYHTPQDSLAHVDPGTLQHEGETALALVRTFASGFQAQPQQEAIFFNLAGDLFIHYPASWAKVLAILGLGGLVLVGLRLVRTGRASVGGTALAALALLACLILSVAVGLGLERGMAWLHRGFGWTPLALHFNPFLGLAVTAGILAVLGALLGWLVPRLGAWNVALAGLAYWSISGGLTAWLLPGGSYLFQWPTFLGLGLVLAWRVGGRPWWGRLAVVLLAIFTVPMVHTLWASLGFHLTSVVLLGFLASLMFLLALVLWGDEQVAVVRVAPLFLGCVAVAALVGGLAWSRAQAQELPAQMGHSGDVLKRFS